nr:4-hydroxybenzoate polyprenyltransferase, mitochondrial-like [Danaus plexippus plexippus]
MFKSSLQSCRFLNLSYFVRQFTSPKTVLCLYGQNQLRNHKYRFRNARIYSTQSDRHRQKAVIETTTPKIVLDKIKEEKMLPEEKIESGLSLLYQEKIMPYIRLARWDRPIGVYLLYWPCAWSISLASLSGTVPPTTTAQTALLFLVGAGLMRGAGCTINDLWDRDVDAQSMRLQTLLVIIYPLAKRFTNYPQLFLGATFNWGALLGYSAICGSMDLSVCLPLYISAMAWTVLYDTIYAHQDKQDDARLGIKSTALTFGDHTKPALTASLAVSLCGLTLAGVNAGLNGWYYTGLGVYMLHAGRQIYTLNPDNPTDCADKFKSNSMVGLIILLGILAGGYQQYLDNREKHKGTETKDATRSCVFG